MPPVVAAIAFVIGILGLFLLDRDPDARVSKALWLPILWISIAGSRTVSQWFNLPQAGSSTAEALEGNPLDRNIQAVMIAAALFVLIARRREVFSLLRSNAPMILFFSYCLVSVLWSDFPGVAFKRWTKGVGDVAMMLVVLSDPEPSAAVKRFLARVGFLLVPASVLFIKYFPSLGQSYGGLSLSKAQYLGVTRDKNMLGVVCFICGLGCAWRLLGAIEGRTDSRKAGPLVAQAALLVMVLWLFRAAHSTTSIACFGMAVSLIVASSMFGFMRKPVVVHLLVLSMLCAVSVVLFSGQGSGVVEAMGKDPTLTGRTELWGRLLSLNRSPILGAGYESFWLGDRLEELWRIYWWHPNESHNGYLEVFLNLGAVGLALLAIVIAYGYRSVVHAVSANQDTGALKLAFLVGGLTYGFSEASFRVLNPVWIVFLFATVAVPKLYAAGQPAESFAFARNQRAPGPAVLGHRFALKAPARRLVSSSRRVPLS